MSTAIYWARIALSQRTRKTSSLPLSNTSVCIESRSRNISIVYAISYSTLSAARFLVRVVLRESRIIHRL